MKTKKLSYTLTLMITVLHKKHLIDYTKLLLVLATINACKVKTMHNRLQVRYTELSFPEYRLQCHSSNETPPRRNINRDWQTR